MPIGFYFNPLFYEHINLHSPIYPESPERLKTIIEAIKNSEIHAHFIHKIPRRYDAYFVKKTHGSYFETLYKKLNLEKNGLIDEDTFFSEKTLRTSLVSANTGLEAARDIIAGEFTRAFCCVRPPGHHAESEASMGFCLFNNIAITANYLRFKGFKRILIVDFDVHHGNGTQEIFYGSDEVMFISIHQKDIYPHNGFINQTGSGSGEGFTINIPLEKSASFFDLKFMLNKELKDKIETWNPEILLFSAGFDAHRSDEIAQLNFESEDYFALTRWFLQCLNNKSVPVISLLEGGYQPKALAESVFYHLNALIET